MFESKLEESWSYQEMVQKGLEKGMQQGVEKGEVKALRSVLIRFVETHFPELLPLASKEAEQSTTLEALNSKFDKLLVAKTVEEARQILQETQ